MCDESFGMFCVYLFSHALFKERKLFCFIRNSLTKWNEMKWNNKKALLIAKRSGKEQLLFVDKNNAALYSTMDKILSKSEFFEIPFAFKVSTIFQKRLKHEAPQQFTLAIYISICSLAWLFHCCWLLFLAVMNGAHTSN